jgi:DNA polymerase III sliding clamp (beta) subunit (PCNA family)
MKKDTITEEKAKKSPAGGVLVGKREGQTIIHDKGTEGGYFVGKLHKEGGIKGVNKSTGQPIEVQGGEVIITAPAVADQTKREFEGQMLTNREILSKINEKGGGVSLENGGEIYFNGSSYNYGGKTMTDYEIMQEISNCGCEHEYDNVGEIEKLIKEGQIDLKFYKTTPTHAKEYGIECKNPIYIQTLYITKENRLNGLGKKTLKYLDDYCKKNGNDVIFGHISNEVEFTKDERTSYFSDVELMKYWLQDNGYAINDDNNDFHKVVNVKYNNGGQLDLVDESKKGDHPSRDLNNYSDVLDMEADGMVGAETGLFAGGGDVKNLESDPKRKNIQKNILSLLEEITNSYWYFTDKNFSNTQNIENADYIRSAFDKDGDFVDYNVKIPEKKFLDIDYVIQQINKKNIYTSFANKFSELLKKEGISYNAYPTTYGIGIFIFANSNYKEDIDKIEKLLDKTNIEYYKEYSDAHFVLRFKISKSKENISKIEEFVKNGLKYTNEQPSVVTTVEDSWKVSRYRDGKEIYKKEDKNYSHEILRNKIGEVHLSTTILDSLHGESFNRTYSDVKDEYFDSVEEAKKYVKENYEKMNLTTNKNEGQALSAEVFEWNKVPTNYRNISKVKKVPFTNNPMDKGLDSIVAPFLGKDELYPVRMSINFDKNGITATDFHKLITLPYPNEKYEGIYDINRVKKIKADQPILIDGNYPNYEAVIPKSNVIKPYEVDVYKLLQYTKTAINYANKTTRGISFKFGDNDRIGFNGSLLSEVLTASLKLGHEKLYAFITNPNRAMVLSPKKHYELGSDEILLIMPVMLEANGVSYTEKYGTITEYGAEDIDYNRSIKAYFDFNDSEIHNADGSVAEFKMQYENNLSVDDRYLGLLSKMTSKKVYLPILQYVKVENGKMTATDLDVSLIIKDVNMPNGIYEIVNKAPNITMNPIEDFPKERIFKSNEVFVNHNGSKPTAFEFVTFSEVFEFYLDKLLLSVGKDDLRPVMSGICIKKTSNNELFLVTTDAHTLCKINITDFCDFDKDDRELEYILPVKYLKDFIKLADGSLHFKCNLTNIFIEADNLEYIAKAIDGKYPNYDAVIPRESTKAIVFDHVVMNKCLKSQEMTNLLSKYKGQKDILFDFFNIGDTLNVKVSESKSYNVQSDLIETIELCKIDLNYKEVENNLSLDQSVFLLMPSKDNFKENQYFSFRKEFFDTMLETITDTEVECYFTEPNRAYIFPIDAIDYKKTLPEEKTKQQKLSKKDLEQISELEDLKDVLEPIADEEPNELQEAIETLEMLIETAKGKDKKDIKEALEILKMLNENN